jgi:hypothetical protein
MNLDGCPGCEKSAKQQQKDKDAKRNSAKILAVKEQRLYVLYEDDEGRTQFMEGEAARAARVRVIEYISQLPNADNG